MISLLISLILIIGGIVSLALGGKYGWEVASSCGILTIFSGMFSTVLAMMGVPLSLMLIILFMTVGGIVTLILADKYEGWVVQFCGILTILIGFLMVVIMRK